jgi:hypothetical protein
VEWVLFDRLFLMRYQSCASASHAIHDVQYVFAVLLQLGLRSHGGEKNNSEIEVVSDGPLAGGGLGGAPHAAHEEAAVGSEGPDEQSLRSVWQGFAPWPAARGPGRWP